LAVALAACGLAAAGSASAQTTQFVGEVRAFGFNFCPKGWLVANGQTLQIQQWVVLFNLYGTTYGGNGTTTFNLPNLQGRSPTGATPQQPLGTSYGASSTVLTKGQLPPVRPQLLASSAPPTSNSPHGAILGTAPPNEKLYAAPGAPANEAMSPDAAAPLGGGQPVPTQSPALAMTWCVAAYGVFPSQN
jgi:microcystin-dependent protein